MRAIMTVQGKVYPIPRSNIDTDQIVPAYWMKRIERTGYADALFENWRRDPNFVLNDPRRKGANIILAGQDYGSGSSREHAVWAQRDFGIEAVIAPSIADIHRNNLPSGPIVPCEVSEDDWQILMKYAKNDPEFELLIDLTNQIITAASAGITVPFTVDASAKHRILHGIDFIDETLLLADDITAYEARRASWLPKVTATDPALG